LKQIALIGANGNMGKRYASIMKHLDIPFVEYDVDNWQSVVTRTDLHSIIITTPTDTHYNLISHFLCLDVPILCEKPVSMYIHEIDYLLKIKAPVAVVNQYSFLPNGKKGKGSHYHYWNSGKDGLAWDCISIIGLSDEPPQLSNTSPVWQCRINGVDYKSDSMDQAYIDMISSWHKKPKPNMEYVKKSHQRVIDGFYTVGEKKNGKTSSNRDSSQVKKHKVTRKVSNENRGNNDVGPGDKLGAKVSVVSKQPAQPQQTR
jgi:hypothetical protein